MTLRKHINELSRSELLKLNRTLKNVCEYVIGKKGKVSIRTYNTENNRLHGQYDYNTKTIKMWRNGLTLNKYIEIFIHEWTHSLQTGLKRNYSKMDKKYGYRNNPYEVEARLNEKIYKSIVWKITKDLMIG